MSKRTLIRESASLLVLARHAVTKGEGYNFKVLGFNRSEKTSFMPNHTVFPGGATDKADETKDWLNHFKNFNIPMSAIENLAKIEGERPKIFHLKDENSVIKEVSLRITAIRETFEELGVLICRKRNDVESRIDVHGKFFEDFDRKNWQEVVHNDPTKFLELCQKLDVIPDLWSLYEWSVWITPTSFKKRFATAFFIVTLKEVPDIIPEPTEVQQVFWKTPDEFLEAFKNSEIWLPPPQVYELSRLRKIEDFEKMSKFVADRSTKGTMQILPVMHKCSDALVSLFNGDDFYPKDNNDNDILSSSETNISAEEFLKKAKKVHRLEMRSTNDSRCYLNFELPYMHLSPATDENTLKSKI